MPATLLKAETLPCQYVNLAHNFLFSIDTVPAVDNNPPTGDETLDPTQANRIQIFFSNGAALLGNIPDGSTLKMFSDTDHATPLAVWTVKLFAASFFNAYPVALQPITSPTSAAPVVHGVNYYFELWSPEDSPPPPPPPQQVLLLGDSITLQGGNSFQSVFPGKTLVNLGINGYKSGQLLSQIQGGGLASYTNVTNIVLNIGTNDLPDATTAAQISSNISAILGELLTRFPTAVISLTLIFPRYDTMYFPDDPQARNAKRLAVNSAITPLANGRRVKLVDVTADPAFAVAPYTGLQSDKLHLVAAGYSVWTAATTASLASNAPPGTIIAQDVLHNIYGDNNPGEFYFTRGYGVTPQELDPAAAVQLSCFFTTNAASALAQLTDGDTLVMYTPDFQTVLAQWTVKAWEPQDLSNWPISMKVVSLVFSAGPITAGGNYGFRLYHQPTVTPDILATIRTSTPSTPSSSNVTPTVSQIVEVIVNGGTPSQETVSLGANRSLPVHTGDVLQIRWRDVNSAGPSDVWSDTLTVVASVPASGLPGKAGVGSVTFSPL